MQGYRNEPVVRSYQIQGQYTTENIVTQLNAGRCPLFEMNAMRIRTSDLERLRANSISKCDCTMDKQSHRLTWEDREGESAGDVGADGTGGRWREDDDRRRGVRARLKTMIKKKSAAHGIDMDEGARENDRTRTWARAWAWAWTRLTYRSNS